MPAHTTTPPERVLVCDAKLTTVNHDLQREVLGEYGLSMAVGGARTETALVEELDDAGGLIVDAGVPVTRSVFEQAPKLAVVGRAGIGVDNVDLAAAADHGVTVVNHPTYSIDEVATHTVGLLVSAVRRIPTFDRQVRAGGWDWSEGRPVRRLQGSTIGFLGFGKIPRRVAAMVSGFGCDLLATDPYVPDNVVATHNVERVGYGTLLDRADVLSVHVPHTDETDGLVDADALARLADDAILVNTARGPVVDTEAVVEALDAGTLGFAALDVTDPEPLPEDHPLRMREDVVVTPHTAWYSEAARDQLSREIAEDVGRVLTGESPLNEVSHGIEWG